MAGDTLVNNSSAQPQEPRGQQLPRRADIELNLLSVKVDDPWYTSLLQQIRDRINPPNLPPLQLTSKPAEVRSIWGDYRYGRVSSLSSILVHTVALSLLLIISAHKVVQVVKENVHLIMPLDINPYEAQLPPSKTKAGGGGGGGDRSPEPASKGKLPKFAMEQKAPPEVVIRNPNPKLPVEPTVIVPPQISLPQPNLAMLGDPLAKIGAPSNGTGGGGGIGNGYGGGVGSGNGGGVGPGEGGGIGGGVFHVGGGVSAPVAIFQPQPEYSEQARKAKYQGSVMLSIVVQRDGTVRDIRVLQPLGLGLDEKAIEAVKQWKFRPGMKSGAPVDVQATVEVTFRLL